MAEVINAEIHESKAMKDKTITLEATLDNLDDVLAFLDGELEQAECPMKTQMQIDIAVEELFVNIASYAYEGKTGEAQVRVRIEESPRQAVITFSDAGIPYDPLAKEDPDVTLSAEERGIGGLGIFMVKKSMDEMFYRHENGRNITTIVKKF